MYTKLENLNMWWSTSIILWCSALSVLQECPAVWLWWWLTSWRWRGTAGWSLWRQCVRLGRVRGPIWASCASWRSLKTQSWQKWVTPRWSDIKQGSLNCHYVKAFPHYVGFKLCITGITRNIWKPTTVILAAVFFHQIFWNCSPLNSATLTSECTSILYNT